MELPGEYMRKRTSKIVVCFLAATTLIGTSYLFFKPKEQFNTEAPEDEEALFVVLNQQQLDDAGIKIQPASSGQLQQVIHSPGKIVLNSKNSAIIAPNAMGTVKETTKNVGDNVRTGEVIALMESPDIAEAKSTYLDSLKKKQQTQANLERERSLYEKHISSEVDFQNAFIESEKARIEFDLAKQKLQTKGLTLLEIDLIQKDSSSQLANHSIRSTLDGVIIQKNVQQGEMVEASHPLYVVADLSTVVAELKVFPKDLPYVAEGFEIDIYSPEGISSKALVDTISPLIDEETYSVSVLALLQNQDRQWKPGMYIQANIKGMPEWVSLLVPKEAIQKINHVDSLFVANQDRFEIRSVMTGKSDDTHVEILSGLSEGDSYAATGTFLLKAEHGKHEAQHMD